jgi:hypothetical protein
MKSNISTAGAIAKGRLGHTSMRVVIDDISSETVTWPVPSTLAKIVEVGWPARALALAMALFKTLLMPLIAGVISSMVAFAGVVNSVFRVH